MATVTRRAPRDRSDLTHRYIDDNDGSGVVVYCDVTVSRRKRHHMICTAKGAVLFRSRWFADILDWLADEGVSRYLITTEGRAYTATLGRAEGQSGE